jgi:uncharacterized membrane protein YqhA
MSQSTQAEAGPPLPTTVTVGPRRADGAERLTRLVLSSSRYFMLLAVLGSFFAACGALLFAWIAGIAVLVGQFAAHEYDEYGIKHISVEVVTLVDLLLLGTGLYIIASGLYQLFIDPAPPVKSWLLIRDLDELKHRLLSTVSVLLVVSFFGFVVTWDGEGGLVSIGLAIGAVLLGLFVLLRGFGGEPDEHQDGAAPR